ncbi:C6 transcription factor [Emericellopsis atlantica]|uniref:C6 transcription factor n=1 Tax=Emericellopsis atlantica TaxID=2614577 RepID=A0A9P8CK70_9HYPO|nr:C6 transcription factor [Emericellopsis atlantica]KAG9249747.1 C6 transcription factor [Emericellopsis atlantica]
MAPASDQKFNRAYKACKRCRARKTRCDITAEQYAAGQQCARCRRQMVKCVFPTQRNAATPTSQRSQSTRADDEEAHTQIQASNSPGPRMLTSPTAPDRIASWQETPQPTQCSGNHQQHDMPHVSGGSGLPMAHEVEPVFNNRGHEQPSHIPDSMMRTVVSNDKDALDLLFQAAQREGDVQEAAYQNSMLGDPRDVSNRNPTVAQGSGLSAGPGSVPTPLSPAHSLLYGSHAYSCTMSTNLSKDLVETWESYRFVRMGWFSAQEAVTYVDLFFQNMAMQTPVLDDFYLHHRNHYWLLVREPLLCATILLISTRYHVLPIPGGESRGFLAHQRLWDHCEHLLRRILLGQEKASKAKTRTFGSIEAILLLTQWQPRNLHCPPAADGWDSDILFTAKDERDNNQDLVNSPSRARWLEDVVSPAKRFDRMSWMMIGVAATLANELGVFDVDDAAKDNENTKSEYEKRLQHRRVPLATMLHIYQEQFATRLGRKSMMSEHIVHSVTASVSPQRGVSSGPESGWGSVLLGWTELTRLMRSISDMLFPSAVITKHLLQSGRYISMIEHFVSLISLWEKKYANFSSVPRQISDVLAIELQHVKVLANSLGLQAIVERRLASPVADQTQDSIELSLTDYGFLTIVVDGCLRTLEIAIDMHQRNALRFAPASTFVRITTASVFLLKGLGLGVNVTKLVSSLEILSRAVAALRVSRPDDLHLGARYASLLEVHVERLRSSFVPAARPPEFVTRHNGMPHDTQQGFIDLPQDFGPSNLGGDSGVFDDSWLALPFDSSLLPFIPDECQDFQGLGDHSLDFIWNLGTE